MTSKLPDIVDQYIGRQIRWLRQEGGMSQSELGYRVGVTFQQIQKYEQGTDRITVSRLAAMADVFSKPPGYFFEGLKEFTAHTVEAGADADAMTDLIDDYVVLRPHGDPALGKIFRDLVAKRQREARTAKKREP